jgi:hypothetical protein
VPGRWTGAEGASTVAEYESYHYCSKSGTTCKALGLKHRAEAPGAPRAGRGGEGRTQGTWKPGSRSRGPGITIITLAPSGQTTWHRYRDSHRFHKWAGCVGVPSRRHTRTWEKGSGGQTGPVSPRSPGLTRLSETAGPSLGPPARRKPPLQDPRGARPRSAEQTPHGPRWPFIVARSGEGVTEARTTPGRTWAVPTPQDASRKGRWRRARSSLGRGPTTPGPSPGWRAWWPADCPRVSRESTGRAGPCKRLQ